MRLIKSTSVTTQCQVVKLPPLKKLIPLEQDQPKQPLSTATDERDAFRMRRRSRNDPGGAESESEYKPSSKYTSDSEFELRLAMFFNEINRPFHLYLVSFGCLFAY